MGLLDLFLSEDRLIDRNIRKLNNRDSTPEDREASARWLAQKGTPRAIGGLLQRFDLNLEHQMKDAAEKEMVYGLIASKGVSALDPTRAFAKHCRQFASPLKLFGELAGADAQFELAAELLEAERKKDDFKPDKKRALLVWMADQRRPTCIEVARPFLEDFDEGVRYAAAEVVIAQTGAEARDALETVFANPREESNRLKIRVAGVFAQRGWSLRAELADRLPSGFVLRDGRVAAV